jgi:OMF family outer membrane factor
MSRKFLVLSALALGLIVPASAKTYTREEAVKTAMDNSAEIKNAEESVVQAASQVDGGYGAAYPSLDLSAGITRYFGRDDVVTGTPVSNAAANPILGASVFDKTVIAPAADQILNALQAQGYRWQSNVGLTLTQILYAQGKIGTGVDIAKAYKLGEEVKLEQAKETVRYNVENAFDELVVLDSSMVIYEESIELTTAHYENAKQSFESGMGKELDKIRAELALDKLKSEYEQKKKLRVLARNNLLNTMGLEWDSDVQFTGELRSPDSNLPFPDTAMANVLKRRKEIAYLKAKEDMASKNIDIEEADYKPLVTLTGRLGYNNNQNEITEWDAPKWKKLNKSISLNLSMNLFKGFQTREKVTQAKSTLRTIQITKENTERALRMQIEACVNTLEDAQTQLELQKRQIELSAKNYDLTNASYQVGRETQVNLLNANVELREAKVKYMQAMLNWNKAYNALLQATGEY